MRRMMGGPGRGRGAVDAGGRPGSGRPTGDARPWPPGVPMQRSPASLVGFLIALVLIIILLRLLGFI